MFLFTAVIILVLQLTIKPVILYGSGIKAAIQERSSSFPEELLDNDFRYNVKFLWFNNMAEARLFFKKGKNPHEYKAVLEGRTKGFIGWLTSHRMHRYASTMELIDTPNGPHLRSSRFLREVIKGEEKEETAYILDYKERQVTVRHSKKGMDDEVNRYDMPGDNIYEDLLSAYFNFKSGVFGNIKKGAVFEINTISKKQVLKVKVTVVDDNTRVMNELTEINDKASFIIKLELDRELFGQKNGIVWAWTDMNIIPLTGRIVDVIGFGDVWGTISTDSAYFTGMLESSK